MGRTRRSYVNSLERAIVGLTAAVYLSVLLAVAVLVVIAQTEPYTPRTLGGWLLMSGGVALTYGVIVLLQPLVSRDPFERWLDVHLRSRRMSWIVSAYASIRSLLLLGLIFLSWWIVISRFNQFSARAS